MCKTILLVILIILSNITYAGFSPGGKITELYSNGSWILVKVDNPEKENPDGCTKPSYYGLNLNSEGDRTILSMLLAAQMAQKSVSFWVGGCEGQGNDYPAIVSIKLVR